MRTHKSIIEESESNLFKAMIECNIATLQKIMHVDFIYTDETGQFFTGINNQPILNSEILCLKKIEIIDRTISVFNNVAIVNSFENRSGTYLGIHFNGKYRHSRIWKFNGRLWILIAATASIV